MIKKFLLGSDPEIFLVRKGTNELFPAIGVITGTKNKPEPMGKLPKGFTWQVDNMALEFNTPPSSTAGEWVKNHSMALDFIKKNISQDLELIIQTSGDFDNKYLNMPGAKEFGCSQTLNAWKQEVNPPPACDNPNRRCVGGHLHIGFEEGKDLDLCEKLIKTLDLFCTVPSLFIDNDTDRRTLYGKAGEFRFATSYIGCEHRSLSNFWLASEELTYWVYQQVEQAIKFINEGKSVEEHSYEIQSAINDYDLQIADKLLQIYDIKLPQSYASNTVNRTTKV